MLWVSMPLLSLLEFFKYSGVFAVFSVKHGYSAYRRVYRGAAFTVFSAVPDAYPLVVGEVNLPAIRTLSYYRGDEQIAAEQIFRALFSLAFAVIVIEQRARHGYAALGVELCHIHKIRL